MVDTALPGYNNRVVRVLSSDRNLIAVAKPSGMLVHRSSEAPDRDVLLQRVRDLFDQHLYPIHRLDRAASGIVLFARSAAAAADLQAAMQHAAADKRYIVLARGHAPESFEATRPLRNERGEPQECRSDFECLEQFEEGGAACSLLSVRIHTGRRHQIRRHLNHAGHHVIGDTTHGKGPINRLFRERFGLHRLFLHGSRLDLSGVPGFEEARFDCELPQDLSDLLAKLRGDR